MWEISGMAVGERCAGGCMSNQKSVISEFSSVCLQEAGVSTCRNVRAGTIYTEVWGVCASGICDHFAVNVLPMC